MFCPKCNSVNSDYAKFCSSCGEPLPAGKAARPGPGQPEARPEKTAEEIEEIRDRLAQTPTYLVQNILLTVFSVICCLWLGAPTSIAALVFSGITQGAINRGEPSRAAENSRLARIFMWISFGILIACVLFILISIIAGFSLFTQMMDRIISGDFNFDFDNSMWY